MYNGAKPLLKQVSSLKVVLICLILVLSCHKLSVFLYSKLFISGWAVHIPGGACEDEHNVPAGLHGAIQAEEVLVFWRGEVEREPRRRDLHSQHDCCCRFRRNSLSRYCKIIFKSLLSLPICMKSRMWPKCTKFNNNQLTRCIQGHFGGDDYPFMRGMMDQALNLCQELFDEEMFIKVGWKRNLNVSTQLQKNL